MNTFEEAYRMRPFLFGKEATEELIYVINKFHISGKALELGCGDGRDTKHVLSMNFEVDAIEQSSSALNTLKERKDISEQERARLCIAETDVMKYTYLENNYDFIYSVTLFDHLDVLDGKLLLEKCGRAVKKGGYIFLKVHTVDDAGNNSIENMVSEFASEIKHYYHRDELFENLMTLGSIVYYLESAEKDLDHGEPHMHVYASILIRKEG